MIIFKLVSKKLIYKMAAKSHTAILAFVGLVAIQTSVGVIYKFAGSSGSYAFSESGSLAMSELTKFFISVAFLYSSSMGMVSSLILHVRARL
jgi:hypothetical protein